MFSQEEQVTQREATFWLWVLQSGHLSHVADRMESGRSWFVETMSLMSEGEEESKLLSHGDEFEDDVVTLGFNFGRTAKEFGEEEGVRRGIFLEAIS